MKVDSSPAPKPSFDPIRVVIVIESLQEMCALRDMMTYYAKTSSSKSVTSILAEAILPHVTPL